MYNIFTKLLVAFSLLPALLYAQSGTISWPAACPTNNCPTAYTDANGVKVTVTSAYGTGTGAAVNLQQLQGSTAGVFGVSQTSSAPSATQGLGILLDYGINYTDAKAGNMVKIAFDKPVSGVNFIVYDLTSPWLGCTQVASNAATYNDNVIITGTSAGGASVQAAMGTQSSGYFGQSGSSFAYIPGPLPSYMRETQTVVSGNSAYVTGGYINQNAANRNVNLTGIGGNSLSVNVSFSVPVKEIQILYKNYSGTSGDWFSYYKSTTYCPAAITTFYFAQGNINPQAVMVGNISYTGILLSLSGSVLNDPDGTTNGVNGTALQNTTVTLYDATGTTPIATTTTDASGNYRFDVNPNTTYVVKVTPPSGYANASSTDATPADGSTTVAVGTSIAGNITGINFGLNQPPVAVNDSLNNQPGGVPATVPNILGNDTDPNGGTLRADSITLRPSSINVPGVTYTTDAQGDTISVTVPGQGTWSLNNTNGSVTFTPQSGFSGNPTPINYTVTDAAGLPSNPATIVIGFIYPPVAVNDTATTPLNTPLSSSVTANDTCRMGPCSYSQLSSDPPAHGTVAMNANGTYTYTPNAGYTGADTFSYVLCNSGTPVQCDTAQVFLAVTGPPVAVNDTVTTPINTPLSSSVIANDTCRMGPCSYSQLSSDPPVHGTVTMNANGTYTYTPNAGYTGADTFSYVLCNSGTPVQCDTAQVFLTVTGPPVAVNDTATTPINTPLSSSVTANDTCRMGPCSYSQLSSDPPAHGTVAMNANGTYTYTPNAGYTGADTFSYVLCNSGTPVQCDTAQVVIMVQGVPVAVNDSATTAINTPVSNTVATNDTCTAGGTCTYAADNNPANGTVTVNADGSYTYTPNSGFTGTDSFTYTICDAAVPTAHCDTATVYVTIQDVPVAVNDSVITTINTPVSNTVATNDTCTAGGTCTYAADNNPANGTVTVNADGTYTYTPNTGFTGTDSFTYTICDAAVPTAHCDMATVYVTIQGVPVAVNDSATTAINTPISSTVATNDTCTAGSTCTYAADNNPANGTVTVNADGSYTYTPNNGFTGTDSFTYTICDAAVPTAHCDTATVYVTIQGVPVAVNDSISTAVNTPISSTVATNDTCIAGGTCTYAADNNPANGTVTVNADGSYTYTPNTGFTGTDSFTYTICDAAVPTAHCDTATVYLTIQGVPVAVNDSATTAINTPVSNTVATNDTCTAGGTCTYAAGNTPANGTVTMNADGSYTYTPNSGFMGTDSFTYTICDAAVPTAHCDTATVYVTIQGVPVAVNDSAITTINTPVSNTVATNDTCTAGGTCTYAADNNPANGTVTVNADGSYTYTPNSGFTGTDTFTYTICDAAVPAAHCDTATVYLTIQGVPVAVNDSISTAVNTPVSNTVATNDTCTAGGTCTYAAGNSPANGTVTVNADGSYTYTPNNGFTGTDSFTYTICDAAVPTAHCDTATVYVTIQDVPVAVNDSVTTTINTPVSNTVATNDTCTAGGTCTYAAGNNPANGTVTVNADGTYTYTPNTGFTGTDSFTYTICDAAVPTAHCDTATVYVTIQGVPVAVNDSISTAVNTPISNTVATNDTCTAGGTCTYAAGNNPANGTVTVNTDGTYTYTPNTGFTGTDSFTYTICDAAVPTAHCDTATVYVTIQGVPVAVNDSISTAVNTPISSTVATNDTCIAGGTCTYAADNNPANGTVTVNADGSYTYTPNNSFTGTDSFTYTICDAAVPTAHCDTATVYLTIQGVPVAVNDSATTAINTPVSNTVATNDTCTAGGTCTYAAGNSPANGTVTMNADGSYTYTPNSGFTGTDIFNYMLCNSATPTPLCDTAQVVITVSEPLPVDLIRFDGKAIGRCAVELGWQTGVEDRFKGFEIESSNDARSYRNIGYTAAKGNGSQYVFEYRDAQDGRNYYRLKLVDADGRYDYSRVATVYVDCNAHRVVKVYPTVSDQMVTIEGVRIGERIMVIDATGRRVLNRTVTQASEQLDISSYAAGTYHIIILTDNKEQLNFKVVKN